MLSDENCWSQALVPPEQVAGIDLLGYIGEVLTPAVGDDDVAALLEGLEVARDLGAEEVAAAVRWLVHQHGHALCLHALHDALNRGGAEVVGPGLHGEAEHADQRLCHAGVDELVHALQHLVGHEVLAGAVGLDDRLDEVLRNVLVVGQELLGVLGQGRRSRTTDCCSASRCAAPGRRRGSRPYFRTPTHMKSQRQGKKPASPAVSKGIPGNKWRIA